MTDRPLIELLMDAIERIPRHRVASVRLNQFGAHVKRIVSERIGREATMDDVVEFFSSPPVLAAKRRCAPCYRKGEPDAKHGRYCHRCGSAEELT